MGALQKRIRDPNPTFGGKKIPSVAHASPEKGDAYTGRHIRGSKTIVKIRPQL